MDFRLFLRPAPITRLPAFDLERRTRATRHTHIHTLHLPIHTLAHSRDYSRILYFSLFVCVVPHLFAHSHLSFSPLARPNPSFSLSQLLSLATANARAVRACASSSATYVRVTCIHLFNLFNKRARTRTHALARVRCTRAHTHTHTHTHRERGATVATRSLLSLSHR